MDGGASAEGLAQGAAALERSPVVAALLAQAAALAAAGDRPAALEFYQAALTLDPDCAAALAGAAETAPLPVLEGLPSPPNASKTLERFRRSLFAAVDAAAIDLLDDIRARVDPDGFEVLALLQLWRGDRTRAHAWLLRHLLLTAGRPDDPLRCEASHELLREYVLAVNAMTGVSSAARARQLARLHLATGDVAAAARHLGIVVAAEDSPEALVLLAALDNAKGHYKGAMRRLAAALPLTGDRAWIHHRKAVTKRALGLKLPGVSSSLPSRSPWLQVMVSPCDRGRFQAWKFLRHFHRAERPDLVRQSLLRRAEPTSRWVFPVNVASRQLSPGRGRIEADRCIFEQIPEPVMKRVKRGRAHLLLDHGHEALFAHKDASRNHFAEMLDYLKREEIPPGQIVVLDGNLKSPETAAEIAARAGLAAPAILPDRYLWFQVSASHRAIRRAAGGFDAYLPQTLDLIARRAPRPWRFLSYNGVPRPHRWALVAWLLERGLLDKGLVSFRGADPAAPPEYLAEALAEAARLAGLRTPDATLQAVRRRSPLVVDDVYALEAGVRWSLAYGQGPSWPYQDSYFSVVTETVFSNGSSSVSTEKLMKPIANLHPFLLIGDPGTLKDLRARGFETYGRWFDEGYDDLTDPRARLAAVLAQIERLCGLSDDDWAGMYEEMQPVMLHNYHAFLELAPKMAEEIVRRVRQATGSDL